MELLVHHTASSYRTFRSVLSGFPVHVFSVYLARSLGSDKFPCTTWPFNLVEFALIFALSTQNSNTLVTKSVDPTFEMVN